MKSIRNAILPCLCFPVVGAVLCGAPSLAQEQATTTLRAYANRIQIPVLVLTADHKRLGRSVAEKLSVSIDSGPRFRPEHVRREGDDPISLSIVLDTAPPQADLLLKIDEAIAELAPAALGSRDHVAVYAVDCTSIHSSSFIPADRVQLRDSVDRVLRAWTDAGQDRPRAKCLQPVPLWDALGMVTRKLSTLQGRRVILAVTNGHDAGSTLKWNELRTYAQSNGVAIFGLTYVVDRFRGNNGIPFTEDPFLSLCALTGGTNLLATKYDMKGQLRRIIAMLRERYIIEFARPWNSTPGQHDLAVAVNGSDDIVRASGIAVPLADPALLADPTTVPSDPFRTPTLGSRRPLTLPPESPKF